MAIYKNENGRAVQYSGSGGGGGHTIYNESGTEMAQRAGLQFEGATITDDETNNVTIVTIEGGGTTIVQKPTVTVGTYTYDGTAQGPTITGLDTEHCTVTNATKTDAGIYTLTIALKNTAKMVWSDMTTTNLTYSYTINKATVIVPTVTNTSLTYNGSAQHPTVTGYDDTLMTRTGYEYTNAGNYTLIFGLIDDNNYQWSSGDTSIAWSIEKAAQTLVAVPASITLNTDTLSATSTISGNINALSVEGGYDTSIVSVTLSNGVVTFTNVNQTSGTASVTITAAASDNYYAGSITIEVVATFKPALVAWSSGTDEEIGAMIDGYYSGSLTLADIQSVWSIGDARNVTISAITASGTGWTVGESHRSQTVQMQILGFDHDTLTTSIGGKTKALITVDTKNVLVDANTSFDGTGGSANTENGYINSTNTNVGGWENCARRAWCNNGFLNALPTYFKNRVKQVNKLTTAGNQSATITTTADYCYLLSEWEIFGAKTYAAAQEGIQYAWYANATANHYKLPKWSAANHVSGIWWERSPFGSSATGFCFVNDSGGGASGGNASFATGLAPACSL